VNSTKEKSKANGKDVRRTQDTLVTQGSLKTKKMRRKERASVTTRRAPEAERANEGRADEKPAPGTASDKTGHKYIYSTKIMALVDQRKREMRQERETKEHKRGKKKGKNDAAWTEDDIQRNRGPDSGTIGSTRHRKVGKEQKGSGGKERLRGGKLRDRLLETRKPEKRPWTNRLYVETRGPSPWPKSTGKKNTLILPAVCDLGI